MIKLAAAEGEAADARQLFAALERDACALTVRGRRRRRTSTWWALSFGPAKDNVGLTERAVCKAREQLERARAL